MLKNLFYTFLTLHIRFNFCTKPGKPSVTIYGSLKWKVKTNNENKMFSISLYPSLLSKLKLEQYRVTAILFLALKSLPAFEKFTETDKV